MSKYYYAGSQRIAMRANGTLKFLLGDHLGSTSLVTDANGGSPVEMRYKAWGEVRYASGSLPTKYTYTGQYSYTADFGLMFYNARWYDVSLGRFAQADTVVSGGVQGLDRYAYTDNNPVKYVDPSGHCIVEDDTDKCSFTNKKDSTWRDDPGYDPDSDSIPGWSDDKSDASRVERSAKVWAWMCNSGGYWGGAGECPDEVELGAWLLYAEGNYGIPKIREIMARIIRWKLDSGMTPTNFAFFTAFFNPKTGNNGRWGLEDWDKLNNQPADYFAEDIQAAYEIPGDDPRYIYQGEPVMFWWMDHEDTTKNGANVDAYYKALVVVGWNVDEKKKTQTQILEWLYIGTCSQAIVAGFKKSC